LQPFAKNLDGIGDNDVLPSGQVDASNNSIRQGKEVKINLRHQIFFLNPLLNHDPDRIGIKIQIKQITISQ